MMAKTKKNRILPLLTAAVIMLAAVLNFGCSGKREKPDPTDEPRVTDAPPVSYGMTQYVRYWPENADPASCKYSCIVQRPQFSKAYTAGYAMNKAVDAYLDELASRIESDYLPGALEERPYSQVACSVEVCGSITNVIFSEEHYYEAQLVKNVFVLMLDERGNELSIRDVFRSYHADEAAAEAVFSRIKDDPAYFDTDFNLVLAAIDPLHGAKAVEDGCVVYVREGALAPFEEGVLEFTLSSEELTPDFVGNGKTLSVKEYNDIAEFLGLVADASAVRGNDIEGGALTPFAATGFMGRAVKKLRIPPAAGRIEVPKADFEALYRSCFGSEFPGVDTAAHDIKLQDGVYSVSASQREFDYNVDMLLAEREGDSIVITGDVMYGEYGSAYSSFVCHVSITLTKNRESPFGFTLSDYRLSL